MTKSDLKTKTVGKCRNQKRVDKNKCEKKKKEG